MRFLPLSDYALLHVRLLTKLICFCPSAILFQARLWQLRAAPLFPCVMPFQPGTHVAITDGGGNGSTAAWLVPQAHHDTLQPLRQKFLRLVADWGVLNRFETISASGSKDETSLFSSHELEKLQENLVEFLCDQGYSCSTAVPAYQPFLLDAWCALSTAVKDIDGGLPHILLEGVPTGILSPIPHSGIWDSVPVGHLQAHRQPWRSAQDDPKLARSLLMQDVEAGFGQGVLQRPSNAGVEIWQLANWA